MTQFVNDKELAPVEEANNKDSKFNNIEEKLGQFEKQLNDIQTKQTELFANMSNEEKIKFESNLFETSDKGVIENKNSNDILNSYVGEGKSFELNRLISETGDSRDNFAKRGTLVAGSYGSAFNFCNC